MLSIGPQVSVFDWTLLSFTVQPLMPAGLVDASTMPAQLPLERLSRSTPRFASRM